MTQRSTSEESATSPAVEKAGTQTPADNTPTPKVSLAEIQWMRAQRAAINTQQQLREFESKAQTAITDLTERPGNGIRGALVFTLLGCVIVLVGLVAGVLIMDLASNWMTDLKDGS